MVGSPPTGSRGDCVSNGKARFQLGGVGDMRPVDETFELVPTIRQFGPETDEVLVTETCGD